MNLSTTIIQPRNAVHATQRDMWPRTTVQRRTGPCSCAEWVTTGRARVGLVNTRSSKAGEFGAVSHRARVKDMGPAAGGVTGYLGDTGQSANHWYEAKCAGRWGDSS